MAERAQILVKGIVQGVGFRPFVYNLAGALDLRGYVTNTSEGVLIDVEGPRLSEFVERLRSSAPPLSRITDVFVTPLPTHGYTAFAIHPSRDSATALPFTLVSPDVSVCDDCLRELLDPSDRRFLYPFINCTNCGPRYSITRSIPYDRPNTTMAEFTMCPDCLREYQDPRNRRFHAQPNACVTCGPHVEFRVAVPQSGTNEFGMRNSECGIKDGEALKETVKLLKSGGIVAVKGIGGFHIACDAENDGAVRRLRENRRKNNKPFAVMSPSIESIRQFCTVSDAEEAIMRSNRRPIALLQKKEGQHIAEGVSPNNQYIGSMLPYTPLHYLLFHHPLDSGPPARPHFRALVMTSGNFSEEPIIHTNEEALQKLSSLVEGFLLHDRDIFMRVDDSVVRIRNAEFGIRNEAARKKSKSTDDNSINSAFGIPHSELAFIRRSRGYAPDPVLLGGDGPEVLGCGADLKNTFTLTKGSFAIISQHMGDMENYETLRFFEESLRNLKAVYRAEPSVIVHDLHPGYSSTRWAVECGIRNSESGMTTFGIQHHYAHIGSVMAEHGLTEKVIGVALDGTGYGTDGRLWGGEFLIADIRGFDRIAQFQYMALPGGEAAIREPWRTATALIMDAAGERVWDYLAQTGFIRRYGEDALRKVLIVAKSSEFSPLASGAGRLFDAVAALIGLCDRNTFEGEAAMALESLTREGIDDEYAVELTRENGYTVVQFGSLIRHIVLDLDTKVPRFMLSTKFHNTIASVIKTLAIRLSASHGITAVALSGGTFQNVYLLNRVIRMLADEGLNVYINRKAPCNDGGISLGQAYLIRERLREHPELRT